MNEIIQGILHMTPLQTSLLIILFLLGGGKVFSKKLDRSIELDADNIVGILEHAAAPFPRHWVEFIDGRIASKLNSLESMWVLRLAMFADQMKALNEKMDRLEEKVDALLLGRRRETRT